MNSSRHAGLILAAGASSRMGALKPLLKIRGRTLLEDQAELLANVGCAPVAVVCGAAADQIMAAHQDLKITWAFNKDWELGSFSSLRTGVAALPDDISGCIVLPIDTPGVLKKVFEELLLTACSKHNPAAVIPTHNGRGGHPVWLSKRLLDHIGAAAPDSRLDAILRAQKNVVRIEVGAPEILRNINTPEEWSEFLLMKNME